MNSVRSILAKTAFEKDDIVELLSLNDVEDIEYLRASAEETLLRLRGNSVYFRGLVEFSNICSCDCNYCGIRKSNSKVQRYFLTKDQIVEAAVWCAEQGYGSVVLQSGERNDVMFVDFVENVVGKIKDKTRSTILPDGVGITLCVGEQSKETYKRFFDAGAHRYLLRIESSSPALFSTIHPPEQLLSSRIECLQMLKDIGFLVGTGVMIGIPGQTIENLANDILFFKQIDADMIGMGPYLVHSETPMAVYKKVVEEKAEETFFLSLKMIAVTRLVLKNVNIAATTALQAMKHDGREQGLRFGANVVMPQLTPGDVRKEYLLYEGKPCLDENAEQCRNCLTRRINSIGRNVSDNIWGDRGG